MQYNWRDDTFKFYAAKEWDEDLDFSRYNRDFYDESLLTERGVYYNTQQVYSLFERHQLLGYLSEIKDLLRAGKHFGIDCYYLKKHNVRYMMHIHSRLPGINNKRYAALSGGLRRRELADPEIDVIIDGLNLGRAMSFKQMAVQLPFGGCKGTVHMDALDLGNMEVLGFLAYAVDRSRGIVGRDMNFPVEMPDAVNERFSLQFVGGPGAGLGESGFPTAYGVYLALREGVLFNEGKDSLAGMGAVVQGIGTVGWHLAELLLQDGVRLYLSDVSQEKLDEFLASHPKAEVSVIPAGDVLSFPADIFSPCAVGGIIHEEHIADMRYRYIFGSANNQLRASSEEEEIRLAKLLAAKDIVFQPEWAHNTGGIMFNVEFYIEGRNTSMEGLKRKIADVIPKNTRENFVEARRLGITPAEYIYAKCRKLAYGDF
jgi:glutamate dehydrogenase/leucine dehydrogenase